MYYFGQGFALPEVPYKTIAVYKPVGSDIIRSKICTNISGSVQLLKIDWSVII